MNPDLPSTHQAPRPQGSALLMVIWAIMFMSFAVMGVLEFISYSVDENALAAREFQALHMAESGVAVGLTPQIRAGDPALRQLFGTDSGFDVVINTEGSRLPIDYITNSIFRECVYDLFMRWGLSSEEANIAVDSLADWIDSDDNPRSQGAESDYYQGRGFEEFPRQQDFQSLEEMLLVRGMAAVEQIKPDWRNYFSVHGDGSIDLNTAPRDILITFCDVQESAADSLIRERNGADGIAGTSDDNILSLDQARNLLGLDNARFETLQAYLVVDHPTRRVESVGHMGETKYKVVVIAKRQTDGSMNYLARYED